MSASRDHKNSLEPCQIPRCEQWIWIREPDPDIADDRGRGCSCDVRATHAVTYHDDPEHTRTTHTCEAHIGDVLDRIDRQRRWHRRSSSTLLPAPVITELTFTTDAHAAAYGRHRILRTERTVTDGVAQTLIIAQTGIPPAPVRTAPPRDRPLKRQQPHDSPDAQEGLF